MVLNLCYAHESNKWPKIAKGRNSNKISFNWLKIKSSDLLLSPSQYIKYQGSRSNTFLDILLTRSECYFIKRQITVQGEIILIIKYTGQLFFLKVSIYEILKH